MNIYTYIYTSGDFDRIYRFSALFSRRASPPQEISRAAKFALKSIPSDSLLSLRNDRRPNDCLNPAVYGQKGKDAKRTRERERERGRKKVGQRGRVYIIDAPPGFLRGFQKKRRSDVTPHTSGVQTGDRDRFVEKYVHEMKREIRSDESGSRKSGVELLSELIDARVGATFGRNTETAPHRRGIGSSNG